MGFVFYVLYYVLYSFCPFRPLWTPLRDEKRKRREDTLVDKLSSLLGKQQYIFYFSNLTKPHWGMKNT